MFDEARLCPVSECNQVRSPLAESICILDTNSHSFRLLPVLLIDLSPCHWQVEDTEKLLLQLT